MKRFYVLLCAFTLLLCVGCGNGASSLPDESPVTAQADASLIEDENQVVQADAQLEPASDAELSPSLALTDKIICVDAGHEVTNLSVQEPYSPHGTATKEAFVGGTRGVNQTEEELNLLVALKLQALLEAEGATVVMTRDTHESDMTSYDRAMLANEWNADLCIRIHADGSTDASVYGMSMLVPFGENLKTQDIVEQSRIAGEVILAATLETTGAKNNGVVNRSDLTGFNFAEVPTILIEMGYMTNPDEDALMETDAYQNVLAEGMCDGIISYFS